MDTCNLLKYYAAETEEKKKYFCPECLFSGTEKAVNKHFVTCSNRPIGKEVDIEGDKALLLIKNDLFFRNFIKKFNRYLPFYTDEFREIPYSKESFYWVLLKEDQNFGTLPIGIAYLRLNQFYDRIILAAVVIFPTMNTNKGYGKWFIRKVNEHYSAWGGIVMESPNDATLKIAEDL